MSTLANANKTVKEAEEAEAAENNEKADGREENITVSSENEQTVVQKAVYTPIDIKL